jgi:hypothetical protein
MSDRTEKSGQSTKAKGLSDSELAALLAGDLEDSERAILMERLSGDPSGQEVLALAASQIDTTGGSLGKEIEERLLGVVRSVSKGTGLCPHCAGDLDRSGDFCPHCGGKVRGDSVTCIRCGNPVFEDASYCPHCGSFFRPMGRGSFLDSPIFLPVLGLISVLIAFVYRPVFLIFFAFAFITFGAWFADIWQRRGGAVRRRGQETDEAEEEKRVSGRKTG